ncbi:hypothetical protein QKT49_gp265 [Acanthamoeba castellanii medusavirus]|uniref:Uncharacterized protein n=1 Tax=Acanthamoeba castellanii medusavirus J1 TaxID=3114988 RepID=A0A3T1CXE2_9VIRU|nr:hypothetical protein QKT49_gp265 [Acanthamoeba castellanii medusavirus]BBI30498.1 hypothetical protein [Acanthamoeba castellanii medusavirus J1]
MEVHYGVGGAKLMPSGYATLDAVAGRVPMSQLNPRSPSPKRIAKNPAQTEKREQEALEEHHRRQDKDERWLAKFERKIAQLELEHERVLHEIGQRD